MGEVLESSGPAALPRACQRVSEPWRRLTRQPRFKSMQLLVLAAVVAAVVLTAHWSALSATAVSFDDSQYLLDNPLVQDPSWVSAGRFLGEVIRPSTVKGYYQPLTMISLMLDTAMGGHCDYLRPYHRTSLILHVLNTVLVMLLLQALFGQPFVVAAFGLLYGVHPMTVETIAWVAERKTLLSAFFALLSLLIYVRYARRSQRGALACSLVAYVLALLAKPISTPLPVVMLVLDYWPLRRLTKRAVLEKIPFFIVGAGSAVVTVLSQSLTAHVTMPDQYPSVRIPLLLCHNIVFYLQKIVWPSRLSSYYSIPRPFDLSHPMVLAGVIGTTILALVLLVSARRTRALVAGWLFFLLLILPAMGIIRFSNVVVSDKFAYLPAIGLLLPLAWAVSRLWRGPKAGVALTVTRLGIPAIIILLAVAETASTRRYLNHWRDTVTHRRYMLALEPRDPWLLDNLGSALLAADQPDEVIALDTEAVRIYPGFSGAHNNLGVAYASQGRFAEALDCYQRSIQLAPDEPKTYSNIGIVYAKLGRPEEAVTWYRKALSIGPNLARTHGCLAAALMSLGKTDEAMVQYHEAVRLQRGSGTAYNELALALVRLGRLDEAVKNAESALQFEDLAESHVIVGMDCLDRGEYETATAHCLKAAALAPDDAWVRNNLGLALAGSGRLAEAVVQWREAVRLEPNNAEAHNNLGLALIQQGGLDEALEHYRTALGIQPENAVVLRNYGAALAKVSRYPEAVAAFRKALGVDPHDAETHYYLGWTLARQGHPVAAAAEYRAALRLRPAHGGALEGLAALGQAP